MYLIIDLIINIPFPSDQLGFDNLAEKCIHSSVCTYQCQRELLLSFQTRYFEMCSIELPPASVKVLPASETSVFTPAWVRVLPAHR